MKAEVLYNFRKILFYLIYLIKSDVHLVYLDFDTFKRLMGPIENILKRDSNRYDNYMRKLI